MRHFGFCLLLLVLPLLRGAASDTATVIREAVALANLGKAAEALQLLNTVSETENLPTAYFRLKGSLEAQNFQFESAERDLSAVLMRDGNLPDVLYTLGLVRLQRKNAAGALEVLRRSAQLSPNRAETWLALGETYGNLEQPLQVDNAVTKALSLQSESAVICFGAGMVYWQEGQFVKAAPLFRRAATLAPLHRTAKAMCIRSLIRGGQEKQALELVRDWRNRVDTNPAQHLEIGIALADAHLLSDAVDEFKTALTDNPSLFAAKYNLALAYLLKKEYDRSTTLAQQLVMDHQGELGENLLGLIKEDQGDLVAARLAFQKSVEMNPASIEALFYLGRTDIQLVRFDDAEHEFRQAAAACHYRCAAPFIGLATVYKLQGQFDQAVAVIQQVIEQRRSDPTGFLYLGDILIRAQRYSEAADALDMAAKLDPSSSLAQYMYAYSLLKRSPESAPAAAVSSLEAAIRLDPGNGLAYFRLGAIYARRGNYKRAETLLRTAVRLDPELKEAQFQYATTLQKLGQSELAKVHFEQFRALNGQRTAEDGRMMEELRRVSPN